MNAEGSRFSDLVERTELGYFRIKDLPSTEELQSYYSAQYYQEGRGSYETCYTPAELQNTREKVRLRWELIANRLPTTGRLLDVGCGEGFVLAHGLAQNWKVRGLDFSSAGVVAQNRECEPFLRTGDVFDLLEDETASDVRYDIVWLQNVLEHVIDPEGLLRTLRNLISPGGMLVVTVPNDFSRLQMQALDTGKLSKAFWISPPDHLSYFTAPTLRAIGSATGWECDELIGDFPVDWYLFNENSNYIEEPSKGKAAHFSRIELENLILENTLEDKRAFFTGLARVGMGRDLTAFFSPTKS